MTIQIGNAAGFLGDQLDAPQRLVASSQLDYLTLEYLAELTLSILAHQREKDPSLGYATDFLDVLASVAPHWRDQPGLCVVTNAGGMNPLACAVAAGKILSHTGLGDLRIGVVTGDDLLADIDRLRNLGCTFENLETGQSIDAVGPRLVSANAYLGAAPIAEALQQGASLVLTGRVADVSLTLGPAVHELGWAWDDWDLLAAGSVAGHLIECGAQVTGGYSDRWMGLDLAQVGYPIAEIGGDGSCVITKPSDSGGVVDRRSVCEQLVYEIEDPTQYITPDVVVDFSAVTVDQIARGRVRVGDAAGAAAPDNYKVSLAYRAGYTASGRLLVYGPNCVARAKETAKIAINRLDLAGCRPQESCVEYLGTGVAVPGRTPAATDPPEVVLRLSVGDDRREVVERFCKEIAPLVTSGPGGLAGYAEGRPRPRRRFAYWPALVRKELVRPQVTVLPADGWANDTRASKG